MSFGDFILRTQLPVDAIGQNRRQIYQNALAKNRQFRDGNFTTLCADNLESLFDLYDDHVFAGGCRRTLGHRLLRFRVSRRMTRAGAMAIRHAPLRGRDEWYEIVVSATLLFQTFREDHRPVAVSGIRCTDRLEALQRLLEHETVHLLELLLWRDSSCAKPRFQSIASRFFGHLEHSHELITPDERAWATLGLRRGSRVRFTHEGREFVGMINRITRRATVLVESRRGVRYTDGKKYEKYYVPLNRLRPAVGAFATSR